MHAVLTTVAPIFGLIALGTIAGRRGWLGVDAGQGLTEFVLYVAVPALLFRTLAVIDSHAVIPFGLMLSYYGALAAIWLFAALVTWVVLRRPAADGASIAMGASFGNIVMLGLPLGLAFFGERAATPMALIISISSPVMWLVGSVHMALAGVAVENDAGGRSGASYGVAARVVEFTKQLACNPIILAVLAGSAWRYTGLGLDPIADQIVTLLGKAAVPGALFALGFSLSRVSLRGQAPTVL
ncbi:MAG TPA: AEC family transporter, partial [Hyphomicrobiaceae bacterium]|nr:AEC family transporter [Hyphomicrobiaceae bacterium]